MKNFLPESAMPAGFRTTLILWAVLVAIPDATRAADVSLVTGEPVILTHPAINKSVGHPVYCVQFLPGSRSLATGTAAGVLIWDVQTGEAKQTLEVDDRGVETLVLDEDETVLVAGSATGLIRSWDANTLKPLHDLGPTAGAVVGLAVSPDGSLLASASPNRRDSNTDDEFGVILWDLTTGKKLKAIAHPAPSLGATSLAFMPDGQQLITAQDRSFRVIDTVSGETSRVIDRPELQRTIGCLVLRRDGRQLATGVFEPRLRLWDVRNWKLTHNWPAHDQEPVPRRGLSAAGFSHDGRFVITGGMDNRVCVWDAGSGRQLLELDGGGNSSRGWVTGVAMSPDGQLLAATHFNVTATIWRISEETR